MSAAALAEIAEIRRGLDDAFEALMDAAEHGLSGLASEPADVNTARTALEAVIAGCAFHDLAGQRLSRLADLLSPSNRTSNGADLLFGPARTGEGLTEADLVRLLADGGDFRT